MESPLKDWSAAYRQGHTPWDLRGVTPPLEALVADGLLGQWAGAAARIAVPGCGRGHDVRFLASLGYRLTGFDVAPEAVAEARQLLALNRVPAEVLRRDVFGLLPEWAGAFDLVYDYTCFCALPPRLRGVYARTLAELLMPSGAVLMLAYPMAARCAGKDGPPYLVTERDLRGTMDAVFGPARSFAARGSVAGRAGAEQWFVWTGRAGGTAPEPR